MSVVNRLTKEYNDILKDPPSNCTAAPKENNI